MYMHMQFFKSSVANNCLSYLQWTLAKALKNPKLLQASWLKTEMLFVSSPEKKIKGIIQDSAVWIRSSG